MLYANTHYENNHKIYIVADIFEESLHDYGSHYNGSLSQFNITQTELHDKYDIHAGSIFGNLTKVAQEFFTKATIAYKQEELNNKAQKAFIKYNEDRAKDYLLALLEHEAYNAFYLNVESVVLKAIAKKRDISIADLTEELIKGINNHNNLLVNYQEYVGSLSKEIERMDFYNLYDLNVDEAINNIIYRDQKVEVVKKKSKK